MPGCSNDLFPAMIIDFTEPVDYQLVKGMSLTLIRSYKQVPLDIISVQPDRNGHSIIAVITDLFEDAPVIGDHLMIASTGPIADGFGNHAHPLNRPVVLTSSETALSVVNRIPLR
jgi:hypothetical protein